MPFRQIYTTIWAEPWFQPLSGTAKLLYLYLLTSDATRPTGALERSAKRVAQDINVSPKTIFRDILSLKPHVQYFPVSEIFWVPKFPVWQGRGPKWLTCVKNSVVTLPPEVKTAFNALYHDNTLSDTLCHTLLDTHPDTHLRNPFPASLITHHSSLIKQQTTVSTPPEVPPRGGTYWRKGSKKKMTLEERRQSLIRTEVKHPGLSKGLPEDVLAEAAQVRAQHEA